MPSPSQRVRRLALDVSLSFRTNTNRQDYARAGRLPAERKTVLGSYAALTHQLEGEPVRLDGGAIAPALARFIQESHATEVILGHRRRGRWEPWDTSSQLIRLVAGVDVHILRAGSPVATPPVGSDGLGG